MEKSGVSLVLDSDRGSSSQTNLDLFKKRLAILGRGQLASELCQVLCEKRWTNLQMIGEIAQNPSHLMPVGDDLQIIGSYENLCEVVERFSIHAIVVCVEDRRLALPVKALLDCKANGIEVIDGHQFFEEVSGRLSIDQLRPSALIFSTGFKRRVLTKALKRVTDSMISAIGLVSLIPLYFVIGLLIKIDSPGPVLYRQMRVGLGGQPFMIWKFRSMQEEAESNGPRWAVKHDPRISRVGRILRKSRLDELPQLYNVLRGEMSLVGPRPERPVFVNELRKSIPYYDMRHTVRPGLTGWAQTQFRYGSTAEDAHSKLQYDLYYVKNMTFGLDLRILVETIRVVLLGEGAH
jgi:sugar transferase (PEP-CTERM system associated)